MKRFTAITLTMLLALGGAGLAGCDDEGPAEEAGEQVDEAMENAADTAEEAGDEAADAVDDATDQ